MSRSEPITLGQRDSDSQRHAAPARALAANCTEFTPLCELLVYTDYAYQRDGGRRLFRARVLAVPRRGRRASSTDASSVLGRRRPATPGEARYELGDGVRVRAASLVSVAGRAGARCRRIARSLAAGWRAIGDGRPRLAARPAPADPRPRRRSRSCAGAGASCSASARTSRPTSPRAATQARRPAARGLRCSSARSALLARRCPTVVVGPELARNYAALARLLEIPVSLVPADQIVDEATALARDYDGELTVLSVGRLDTEKNPLLLADVLARLRAGGGDWRLEVCGEGPLAGALAERLRELGVAERAELRGYVALRRLHAAYREAPMLLHSSVTEGLPQVLLEAFAAGLPVVATDVGGIGEAVGEAVLLVAPGDAGGAASALEQLAADPAERERLVRAGIDYAREHSMEAELDRLAAFLEGRGW